MDRQEDRANILIADWLTANITCTQFKLHAPQLHTFSSLPDSSPRFLALLLSSSSSRFSLLPAHVIKLDVTVGTGRCEPHSNDHGLVQRMHPGKEHSGRCMRMRTFHQVTTHHSFHLSDVT